MAGTAASGMREVLGRGDWPYHWQFADAVMGSLASHQWPNCRQFCVQVIGSWRSHGLAVGRPKDWQPGVRTAGTRPSESRPKHLQIRMQKRLQKPSQKRVWKLLHARCRNQVKAGPMTGQNRDRNRDQERSSGRHRRDRLPVIPVPDAKTARAVSNAIRSDLKPRVRDAPGDSGAAIRTGSPELREGRHRGRVRRPWGTQESVWRGPRFGRHRTRFSG